MGCNSPTVAALKQLFSANNQLAAEMVTCDGEIRRTVFASVAAEGSTFFESHHQYRQAWGRNTAK